MGWAVILDGAVKEEAVAEVDGAALSTALRMSLEIRTIQVEVAMVVREDKAAILVKEV